MLHLISFSIMLSLLLSCPNRLCGQDTFTFLVDNSASYFAARSNYESQRIPAPMFDYDGRSLTICNLKSSLSDESAQSIFFNNNIVSIYFTGIADLSFLFRDPDRLSHVRHLDLTKCRLSDGELQMISRMKNLTVLSIDACYGYTEKGLSVIGECKSLRVVALKNLSAGSLLTRKLMLMKALRSLTISSCDVVGEDLQNIQNMVNLESVALEGLLIRPDELAGLKQLLEIDQLSLRNSLFPLSSQMRNVSPSSIRELMADRATISQEFLVNAPFKSRLEYISLSQPDLNVKHLAVLAEYPNLKSVVIAFIPELPSGATSSILREAPQLLRYDATALILNEDDFAAVNSHNRLRSFSFGYPDKDYREFYPIKNENLIAVGVHFTKHGDTRLCDILDTPKLESFLTLGSHSNPGFLEGVATKFPLLKRLELPQGAGMEDLKELHSLKHISFIRIPSSLLNDEYLTEIQQLIAQKDIRSIEVDGESTIEQKMMLIRIAQEKQIRLAFSK